MKKIISGLAMVSMLACGGGAKSVPTVGVTNSAEAAKFSGRTVSAMKTVQGGAARGDVGGSASISVKCPTSGSVDLNISAIQSSTSSLKETIVFGAKDCIKKGAYELDGSLTYGIETAGSPSDATGFTYTITLNGTVAAVIYKDDGVTVDQSADVTYDNLKVVVTEKVTSTCTTITAVGSGSMKVGGTSYQPTGDEWGSSGLGGFGSYSSCR